MFVTINLTSEIRLMAYLQNSEGQLRIENSKETHDKTSYVFIVKFRYACKKIGAFSYVHVDKG